MSGARGRGRVLVVEDNKNLALGLRVNLEDAGYDVCVAPTLADGLERLRQTQPQLLILDLSLPDGDGMEFMRRMRAGGDETLILVLTAKSQQDAKVFGLRGGADDYVTKPFDLEELLVRIEVLFRRVRAPDAVPPIDSDTTVGSVEVDVRGRVLRRNGDVVPITRIGFDLLLTLLRHRGSVVTRTELMREVWGYGADVVTRTLDTHVFELRKAIETNPSAPEYLRTVWRIGYRLDL